MFGKNEIVGEKYFDKANDDQLFVTSVFFTLQGEGPFRGEPAVFVRLAKCNLNCSFCFVPSTKITMGDGSKKRIDKINVGDEVMSWSGDKFEPKKVTKTYTSIAQRLIKIESTGASNTWCTPEHPFLVSGKGWINAENLEEGDVLVNWNMSERMIKFNPMFDENNHRDMSKEARDNASINLQNLWKDSKFRESNIERLTGNGNPMKNPSIALKGFLTRENQDKSGLEIKIEKICEGLPIKFVGDGKLIISYKIPDFVVEGQKKVIEVWADDSLWVKKSPRGVEWMNKRRELFAKEGYETLFLPIIQSDLKIDQQYKIREKIAQFIHNGIVIKNVSEVNDGRGFARLYGTKSAERIVYNLEVEDNHTYVANNLVVHNCDTFFDDGDWLTFDELDLKIDKAISDFFQGDVLEWAQYIDNKTDSWYISAAFEWVDRKTNEVVERIQKKRNMVLVITGGEPMLQKNLGPFLEIMNKKFRKTQIESNGTHWQDLPKDTTLVCSPKCSEKGGKAIQYLKPNKKVLERADCLKFVMSADQDSPYSNIPNWAHEFFKETGKPVFISPMNIYNTQPMKSKQLRATTNQISIEERSTVDEVISFWEPGLLNMSENQKNHEYAGKYCARHGFTLNLQVHLFASLA